MYISPKKTTGVQRTEAPEKENPFTLALSLVYREDQRCGDVHMTFFKDPFFPQLGPRLQE
jgi:hypothetical protein